MGAHLRRRDVTGIDRRIAGCEHRQQRRLRPLQIEGDLEITVRRDIVNLAVPGFARILPQLLLRFAHQEIEGAFDVGRRERLAVMPLDALAQFEGQLLVVAAPGPALGQLWPQGIRAILRNVLVVDDEIVEHSHEGHVDRICRALQDGRIGRAVAVIHPQDPALLWFAGRCDRRKRQQRQRRRRGERPYAPHPRPPWT
ncbi:hypothetical protein ACVWWO_005057 [Bradyrhizobium sp. F1.13.1]